MKKWKVNRKRKTTEKTAKRNVNAFVEVPWYEMIT